MYLISPNDAILAVDAVTGSRIWEYRRPLPEIGDGEGLIHHRYSGAKRGLALYGDKIFTVASDNAVIALDARTGKVAWEVFRRTDGYVANTSGPIIANGILIAGGSCQNAPFGCYVTGHDISTGKELWRNEVIPHPDGPGDETWRGMPFKDRWCTGVWGQIVYDPVQNLVHYRSSGICPASDFQRGVAGKNATLAGTDTRWAVRPDTGQVVWRRARYFFALDTDTGKKIWQVRLGSMCCGYPVTYSVDGRQYIAVVAGYGRNSLAPEIDSVTGDNMIYVFALPEAAADREPGRALADSKIQ
jgi:alcohol dehydrogenase (cytochrome c)